MGCKLCTCTKPNEEDRLENDRPKKRTTISNRLKSQLFGRKKDATVDFHPTSEVAVFEVKVTSETQVEGELDRCQIYKGNFLNHQYTKVINCIFYIMSRGSLDVFISQ
jgi:hypothetical protein